MNESPLTGICFTRQFPNPAEPLRGTFVADQVASTADRVDWTVIAPVAWPPRHRGASVPQLTARHGMPVAHPRYPVLPRRMLFARVGTSMANASRRVFTQTVARATAEQVFVHAHELYPSGTAASILCAETGTPLVLSVHGSDLYTNLGEPRWRELITAAAQAATRIICVSGSLAADVVSELGVDPARVRVVPDTYDAERFSFVSRPPREPGSPVRLLTIGRLSAEKGIDVLIEALALLRDRGVSLTATIVGGGREREALERLVSERGLSDSVQLTGPLPADGLAARMAEADLYCLPSRREGFGVALVEALATGLPAVATDSGGPRDIMDADSGALVGAGDAEALADGIATIAGSLDSFDAEAISRRIEERFGPRAVGEALMGVYTEALSEAAS